MQASSDFFLQRTLRKLKRPGTSFQSFSRFFGRKLYFLMLHKLAEFHNQAVFISHVTQAVFISHVISVKCKSVCQLVSGPWEHAYFLLFSQTILSSSQTNRKRNILKVICFFKIFFDISGIAQNLCCRLNFILRAANPVGNYMFKVNNINNRTRCEICLNITIKTPERCPTSFWCLFVNFEHVLYLVLVFLLLTLSR